MDGPQRYCQQVDLEAAVGGAEILVQLLDKDGDGVADKLLVDDAIEAGCSDIASKIHRIVDLSSLSAPYPVQLVKQSARASGFYAWGMGSDGQAMPPHIQTLYNNAMDWAKRVGDRQDSLGETPRPALDPPAESVDSDPDGSGFSIRAMRKSGFR